MSTATIHITGVQAAAVRESLFATRQELDDPSALERHQDKLLAIDALLAQLDDAEDGDLRPVTGSRDVLWNALYDALCKAAEDLAADCNELWRGAVEVEGVRGHLAMVGERLALLEAFAAAERQN